jgi:molybdate transport system substrate-binding protein
MKRPLGFLHFVALVALLPMAAGCSALARQGAGQTPAIAPPPARPKTLTVFAAASLMESFGELARHFEAAHPGVEVVINFAGSQQLRAQLEQGAAADVFASANTREMDSAIRAALVVSGTQQSFARNRLVVILPADNPGKLASLSDLARPGLKLDVADKAVPVGQYTLDALEKMGRTPIFGPGFESAVLKNVVSYENDVKAVVSKVSLGEADVGFVYETDITPAVAPELRTIDIPDEFNVLATYPIALLADAPQPALAKEFIDLVLSKEGQQILLRYGFTPAR